jgi:hypothetical protein
MGTLQDDKREKPIRKITDLIVPENKKNEK